MHNRFAKYCCAKHSINSSHKMMLIMRTGCFSNMYKYFSNAFNQLVKITNINQAA